MAVRGPGASGPALDGSKIRLTPDYTTGRVRVDVSFTSTGSYAIGVRFFNYQVASQFASLASSGVAIQDADGQSQWTPQVVDGSDSATFSHLSGGFTSGQGVQGGSAGESIVFTIQAYSHICVISNSLAADAQYGTAACSSLVTYNHTSGGLQGAAFLTDRTGVQQNVTVSVGDNKDGTYAVSYTVFKAGIYLLTLKLTKDSTTVAILNQAPITVYSAPIFPAKCKADITNGTVEAIAGGLVSLGLMCTDRYDNKMTGRPFDIAEDHFALDLTYQGDISGADLDSLESSVKVVQGDDGTSTVLLTPRISGLYTMNLKFYGQDTLSPNGTRVGVSIPGSPFRLRVNASTISARYTTLTSPPIPFENGYYFVDPSTVLADSEALKPVSLYVTARDAFENVIQTGGDAEAIYLEITEVGRPTYRDQATIIDNGDGTYKATFTPPDAVTYIFNLFIRGEKVLPDSQVLAGLTYTANGTISRVATDNVRTVVTGDGLSAARAGDPMTFTIEARDPQGAPKTVGGDLFRVTYRPVQATNEYGIELMEGEMEVLDQSEQLARGDLTAIPGHYTVLYQINDFGDYLVSVELYLPADGIYVDVASTPYLLTVGKRPPPVQTGATLDSTGTKITIGFMDENHQPLPTDRGGLSGLDDCAKIFDADTVVLLGSGSKCTFPVPETVEVYLGYEATIQSGDKLFFLSDRIRNAERNSAAASGSTPVQIPTDAPNPQIVLRAQSRLGRCDDLTIDLSGSYGTSGRNLSYSYGMLPNAPNEGRIALILVEATRNNQETVVIPGSLLQFNFLYTFSTNVTNFLLESSSGVFQVVRRNLTLPNVVIQGKPVLRGELSKDLYVRADVQIDYSNPIESCRSPAPEMIFTWTLDPDLSDGVFELDSVTRNTSTLFIGKGSLFPGNSYVLKVRGEVLGDPTLWNEATAVIETRYAPLQPFLEAPMQILAGQPLFIDMSKSVDPDDPTPFGAEHPYPFTPFLFNYDCNKINEFGVVVDDNCFQNGYQLAYSRTDYNVTIPAGALGVGNFTFFVIVTKNPIKDPVDGSDLGRRVQVTKRIEVISASDARTLSATKSLGSRRMLRAQSVPTVVVQALTDGTLTRPVVKIRPLSTPVPNYNERLTLSAALDNKNDLDMNLISYEWVVLDGVLNIDDYPGSLATQKTQPNLVIKPYVLTSGQSYTLRVYVRYFVDQDTSLQTFDDITFRVNALPCAGTFSVQPRTGVAGLTNFRLTAKAWEDDQQQALQYEFRYYDPTSGQPVPLISRTATNLVSPTLISHSFAFTYFPQLGHWNWICFGKTEHL